MVSAGPRPPPRAAHTATLIGESLLLYGGAANHERRRDCPRLPGIARDCALQTTGGARAERGSGLGLLPTPHWQPANDCLNRNHEEDLGDAFVLDTAAWAYRRLDSACAPQARRPPPRSSHSAVLLPMSLFDGRGGGRGGGSGNSSGGTSGGGGAVCPSEAGLAVLILGGRDFVPAVTPFSPPQNRSRDDAHLLWLSAGWQVLLSNE